MGAQSKLATGMLPMEQTNEATAINGPTMAFSMRYRTSCLRDKQMFPPMLGNLSPPATNLRATFSRQVPNAFWQRLPANKPPSPRGFLPG